MGYTAAEAHVQADLLGNTFTDDMVERIEKQLGNPDRCPHGWPVDVNFEQAENRELKPLTDLAEGESAEIVRLAEHDGELLHWYYDEGLVPGTTVELRRAEPAAGQFALRRRRRARHRREGRRGPLRPPRGLAPNLQRLRPAAGAWFTPQVRAGASPRALRAWGRWGSARRARGHKPGPRGPRPTAAVATRRGLGREAGGGSEGVRLVRPLPREVVVRAAEVAVRGRLRVDRAPQVEVAEDRARAQVEVLPDELLDARGRRSVPKHSTSIETGCATPIA